MPPSPEQSPILNTPEPQKKKMGVWIGLVVILLVLGVAVFTVLRSSFFSNQSPIQNQTDTATNTQRADASYTASSTNSSFQTYTNASLKFSIDIPKTAYSNISGCTYETNNQYTGQSEPSYRYSFGTTSVPMEAQTIGDTTYIDFSYYYDLVQKSNGSPDYSNCKKQDMSWYLPIYLSNRYGDPFWPDSSPTADPISIEIKSATSTDAAKAIAKAQFDSIAGNCPYTLQMSAASQSGVFDFVGQSPSPSSFDYSSLGEDQPLTCLPWSPIIKYSPNAQEVAIITAVYQSCAFSNPAAPTGDRTSLDCYLNPITSSFKFLP